MRLVWLGSSFVNWGHMSWVSKMKMKMKTIMMMMVMMMMTKMKMPIMMMITQGGEERRELMD